MSFEELKVEGEDGVWFCARHKTTKTRLRCGRCEKPICPKCTEYGPTGARCRDCNSNRDSHMYQVTPLILVISLAVGAVAGGIGAFLVSILGTLSLFALFYAPAIGPVLGRLIIRSTKGKRGIKVALLTMFGVAVGALGVGFGVRELTDPIFWLMLVIAEIGVYSYLK